MLGLPDAQSAALLVNDMTETAKLLETLKSKEDILRSSASTELAQFYGVLKQSQEVADVENFLTKNLLEQQNNELAEYEKLYRLESDLKRVDRLNRFGDENQNLIARIDELFANGAPERSIVAGLDQAESVSTQAINVVLEKTRIGLEQTKNTISQNIIQNLEEVIRSNPDDPSAALRHIQTLLFYQKKYSSVTTAEASAQSGLGRILESVLSPIGEYGENQYSIAGRNYALSDIVDYARASMLRTSLEGNQGTLSMVDDVFDYLSRIRPTNVAPGEDFFSLSTLNRIFDYSNARATVTSETRALKDIPRIMQQVPTEIIEALDSVGMGGISQALSPSIFDPAVQQNAQIDSMLSRFGLGGLRQQLFPENMPSTANFFADASEKTIDLGLVTSKKVGTAYNPAIDADLVNDLLALAAERQEDVESLVMQRYRDRMTSVLTNKGVAIREEDMAAATERYIMNLRRIIAIRRARDTYEGIALRAPGMIEAFETAVQESPVGSATDAIDAILGRYTDEIADLTALQDDIAQTNADLVMNQIAPRAKYTRFGQFLQQQIADNPNLGRMLSGAFQNKGKIIAGAAAATGVAVFAMKRNKDVTPESVSGPPLLPGGNPYENIPTMPYAIEPMPTAGGGQGVSYNVSVNGDYEKMQEFMTRAGYLSNGQMQGTMHGSLPDLGGSHYDDIAGSF